MSDYSDSSTMVIENHKAISKDTIENSSTFIEKVSMRLLVKVLVI